MPEDGLYPVELYGKASEEEVFEVSLEGWLGFNQDFNQLDFNWLGF